MSTESTAMKGPTKEQVRIAAMRCEGKDPFFRQLLKELWPEAFVEVLRAGQVYNWSMNIGKTEGQSGLVIDRPMRNGFAFVSFITGKIVIPFLHFGSTKNDIAKALNSIVVGPERIVSWTTKNWWEDL